MSKREVSKGALPPDEEELLEELKKEFGENSRKRRTGSKGPMDPTKGVRKYVGKRRKSSWS